MADNKQIALQAVLNALSVYNNDADTRIGTAIRDLVVDPSAHLYEQTAEAVAYATKGLTELLQEENPDYDRVDALLGNININRKAGSKASGYVYAELNYNTPVTLKQGFTFNKDDLIYELTSSYTSTPQPINDVYYLIIPVTALETGVAYNGHRDANVVPINNTLRALKPPNVYGDFTGGTDSETPAELLQRLSYGLTTTAPSYTSLTDIRGLVNTFTQIRDINAVGYGSAVVTRDRDTNPFGATGGCIDIYVKNYIDPVTVIEDLGTIQNPDGVEVADVRNTAGDVFSGEQFTEESLLLGQSVHRLSDVSDAKGTVYEQVTATTEEEATHMRVFTCPELSAIQSFVTAPETGALGVDVLVHAAVMLHVSIDLTVTTRNELDTQTGITAIKDYINGLGIGDTLYLSEVTHIINEMYPDIAGVVINTASASYGSTTVEQDTQTFSLQVPADIDNKVTQDTAVFVVEAKDIFINENYR